MILAGPSDRVLICVGSGGVGKTTVSASLAVQAARAGRKTLVMTIDPSQRLRTALGLERGDGGIVRVPEQNYPGELFATWIDAEQSFKDFLVLGGISETQVEKLLANKLYQQLSTTLSGSQEFTALLQLVRASDSGNYDLIILDTPPAQHAIDFLEAPEKLQELFSESIVKWFLFESEQQSLLQKIFARGTATVLAALERLTGDDFISELSDFFRGVQALQGKINSKTESVRRLLRSHDTRFLVITGFDEAKLMEALELKRYLEERDFKLSGLILNRVFPQWSLDEATGAELPANLKGVFQEWRTYYLERDAVVKQFIEGWQSQIPVLKLPEVSSNLSGLDALEALANEF
jgi:anion-transporting  ArsA/GET3 family ATPase